MPTSESLRSMIGDDLVDVGLALEAALGHLALQVE